MTSEAARRAPLRYALWLALTLAPVSASAALFNDNDTARLAGVNEAIQTFQDEVNAALHELSPDSAEEIQSYSYVGLNLEAAHERLNDVFILIAVSTYLESATDELLVLNLMHAQLLRQSRNYLSEKESNISSMAAAHPANPKFAAYSDRAKAILRDRAIPLLNEFYRRIDELPH
jgi:hypothetical protein